LPSPFDDSNRDRTACNRSAKARRDVERKALVKRGDDCADEALLIIKVAPQVGMCDSWSAHHGPVAPERKEDRDLRIVRKFVRRFLLGEASLQTLRQILQCVGWFRASAGRQCNKGERCGYGSNANRRRAELK
jgi:hypothetical protein